MAAIEMFKAKESTRKSFTKDSIQAFLLTVFGISPPNSGPTQNKAERLKLLEQLDTKKPRKIDAHIAKSEAAAVAPTNG